MKGNHFKKIRTMLIAMLFIVISGYMLISTAIAALAQDVDVSKVKNVVDVNLEKYVNYNLEGKKGTLLQLNVKTGIEYEEGIEYVPLSSTGILLNVPKINNKFPQNVEVFEKSTKATNGDEQGKDVRYKYVSETGQIIILTANEEQNGEIYKEYVKDAKDDISIVLDYDESCRLDENTKNQLDITGFVQTKLATQKETKVQGEIKAQIEIEKQVSNVVSSDVKTSDIYNGFIKMNAKNDSNYKTTYNESFGINISKKDLADETKIEIENSFIKNEEKTAIKDISYVSSKINKNRVLDIFGQDGYFKVLDETGKVLAEINKDTQVDKDGNYEIKYADGVSKLFAVFSKPNKVGYIKIDSTKEIGSSFKETDVNKIQVLSKIKSVNKVKDVQNNEIEKEVYNFEDTKEIEIKNTQSVVKLAVNNAKWTNQKQNDLEFNVKLLASESNHSLFKNPIVKILLPEEVEKVVLGNVKVTNGNGLNFKNAEYNNENRILTVTLEGEQAEYLSKNLADGTNVIIPASIILGQEIESKNTNLGVAYVNEATSEKGMFKADVEVENFRQVKNSETEINNSVPTVVRQVQRAALRSETPNVETAEGVEIEVVPTRCTDILNNGDTVYEGEFIKYNIKVKNTTDHDLENVKLIADLPDGVKYVKVTGLYESTKFEYNEEIKQLPIDIGTLVKGQKVNKEFQVRVKDLEKNDTEKQIETTIKAYIGNGLSDTYRISHKVQKADYKVSLLGYYIAFDNFRYELDINGDKNTKGRLALDLPENLEIDSIEPLEDDLIIEKVSDNIYNLTPGKYTIITHVKEKFIKEENCNSLKLSAFAIVNDTYKSNEAITIYEYKNVSVEMSSPTEGERLKCDQEIIYNIKVKNISEESIYDNKVLTVVLKDQLPDSLEPIDVTYTNFYFDEETNSYKKENKTEDIYNLEDENYSSVNLLLTIPAQEELDLIVKARVKAVSENIDITNVAIVEDFNMDDIEVDLGISTSFIGRISSNIVRNTILEWRETDVDEQSSNPSEPLDPSDSGELINPEEEINIPLEEEGINESDNPISPDELGGGDDIGNIPGEDDNNQGDGENTGNGENQGNQEQEGNGNTTDKKYSITGIAWKDENADGQQQDDEQKLSGIEVMLVDSTGKNVSDTTTNDGGQYAFNNLADGNYIVVFKYDTSKYRLTEYQKNGVESNYNSDVIKTEREIDGKSTICGVTNLIKLNSNLENIDIGLIENKKFNFKVENYISKITTTTSNGTDSKDYNNAKLAKTEIKSKEIENASVKVEYKIVITNDGELQGTVGKVVEKLPEGLKLSSDVNNKTWYKNQDGSLVNTSMAGQIIEPGKKLELELIADVSNSSGAIGNYKDTVIIEEISNSLGIVENNTEDNSSSAELIVSVSTGTIIYISIIITAIAIMGLVIFLNKKYGVLKNIKFKKLFIVIILFGGVILSTNNFSEATNPEYNATYTIPFLTGTPKYAYAGDYGYNRGLQEIFGNKARYMDSTDIISNPNIRNYYFKCFIFDDSCTNKDHRDGNGSLCFAKLPYESFSKDGTGTVVLDQKLKDYIKYFSSYQHTGRCIDPGHAVNHGSGQGYSKEISNLLHTLEDYYKHPETMAAHYNTGIEETRLSSHLFWHKDVIQEYFSTKSIDDVKELPDLYRYEVHVPGTTTTSGHAVTDSNFYKTNKKTKTDLIELDNNYYLVGPLAITNNLSSECNYIKSATSATNYSSYPFVVTYNDGFTETISTTYNNQGNNANSSPKGTGTFYLKISKKQVEDHKGIKDIETGIKTNIKVTTTKKIYYFRVWWACDCRDKLFQRIIEIPEKYDSSNVKTIKDEKNTSSTKFLKWTVPGGIVQIQKKEKISTTKDLTGINFIMFKDRAGWVTMNDGIISYSSYKNTSSFKNSLVKLKTKKDGLTDSLIGLDTGKYYIYEIITCNWDSTLNIPDRFRPYYKGVENILPGCKLKKVETKEVKTGKNVFNETNNWDYAPVQLQKKDEIGDVDDLSGINFVLYKNTGGTGWVKQDRTLGYWNNDQDTGNLLKLKTNKNGLTGIYQGLEPADYIVYEIVEGSNAYKNLSMPVALRKLYKATIEYAGCKVKKLGTITVSKPTSAAAQVITVTNKRDKVKLTINKTDEFKNEKIDLSNINFLLYRQKNEYGAPDGRGWVAYDSDGLIEYISWSDSTRDNIKKLAVMTTKKVGNEYVTNQIEGLDKGYYAIYEFIEGCDTETHKLDLPENLRKYYKGSDSRKAGCLAKNVGYINITNGFKQLYDTNGKYVGDIDSNGKIYDSNGKAVTSLSYDSSKTKQMPAFNISVNKGKKVADASNKRDFVDLKLHKEDENEKVNLEGIKFKVYAHEYKDTIGNVHPAGWVKWTKNSKGVYQIDEDQTKAVTTYDKSSTLTTDKNGYTEQIEKLLVNRKYSIYEVSVGTYEKQYEIGPSNGGVKMPGTDKYGKLIETWTAKANKEGVYTREVGNDQYYVTLKGNVWEDGKKGKNGRKINNLLENGDNNISGIIVKLMDKTGRQIKQTITNSDGSYTFDKVLVSEIKAGNYYIEFEYDGLTYQTVNQDKGLNNSLKVGAKTVSIPAANTSKAGETSSRTDLNNSFTELTGDRQAINYARTDIFSSGTMKTLSYTKNNRGTINNNESNRMYLKNTYEYDWIRKEASNGKRGTVRVTDKKDFNVSAKIDADYLKNAYNEMKKGYKDNTKELLFEIPNLNLGLYIREKVDLGLTKDTILAQVDINGKTYKYLYANEMKKKLEELLGREIKSTETSLGVAFERNGKVLLNPEDKYKTAIHEADLVYDNPNGSDGELKVTIVYGIGLVNNSNTLYGKINKIKEYYSPEYKLVDKNIYLDPLCTKTLAGATIENESTVNNAKLENETVARDYKTFDINFGNNGMVISPDAKEQTIIYLKMELPKETFYDSEHHTIYANNEFRNFAEISSYTTYSAYNSNNKTGTLYATYDYNSVPNTINIKNGLADLRKSENDSNYARGLKIELAEERTLSGVVFKDNIDGTIGRKNAAEKGIQNVTVQLVPINQLTKNTENYTPEFMNVTSNLNNVKKYYNDRGLNGDAFTTTTNEKGEFTFKGFIPGDYQIRYIWGLNNGKDSTIIKDGKDTKVSVGEYKSTKYTDVSDNKWYLNESANSRAIDSWKERLDFDKDLPASYDDYVTYNTDNSNKVKGNMNSWTPKLDMGVEVVGNQNQNNIVVGEDGIAKYKFDVKSVNFGLIERPQQQLEVKKELTHVRIKDAQDRVIVDAEVTVEKGKKTFKNIKDVLYTVFLPESSTSPSGTVKTEIDKDYMPVKLEATYRVTVTNTSQVDYKDKDYYYYYKGTNNPVKLKATKVYDYISKDFEVNGATDVNYKVETVDDYNKEINNSINKGSILSSSSSRTIIEAAFEEYNTWAQSGFTEKLLANGTKITKETWATGSEIIKALYEEWYNTITTKNKVRDVKLDGSKIINIPELEKELTAGQSLTSTYTVTSLIQNKDDEIKLDNEVEIIDVNRENDFGKTTISTYKKLYDAGESVIITPPTGEDRSKEGVNILAISLASGLGVLAIGLIFIKRRISKHDKNA